MNERAAAERVRYSKAKPAITQAILEKLKTTPANATGPMAELLVRWFLGAKKPDKRIPARGRTAEDLVRHLAAIALMESVDETWGAYYVLPDQLKPFGIDMKAITDKAAPPSAGVTKKKPPLPTEIEVKAPSATRGVCRKCGCTEAEACQTPEGPCSWANTRKTLCSECSKL